MSVLGPGRRWLRRRRARRLRRRARSLGPADLADTVETARRLVGDDDGGVAHEAVRALAAVARSGEAHPVRDRATDALVAVATEGDDLRPTAVRSLRFLALERESAADRLDPAFARAVDRWDHPDHRRMAVDVGMVLGRPDARHDLPETRDRLHEALVGGPPEIRGGAAVAYVLAADHPDRFERRDEILEHLAIVRGSTEGPIPEAGSTARRFADDRTLGDAIDAFSRAGDS